MKIMGPPITYEKQAWQWAEVTTPVNITLQHVLTAYRLTLPPCFTCKRNVKSNPNCLCGLSSKGYLSGQSLLESLEISRNQGEYVGLKNLGATCYANTFLQLWFHTPEIRRAVMMYHENMPMETDNNSDKSAIFNYLACLQEVFAFMYFSKARFIDPTILLNCLMLDNTVQQDAQEFSKLFISKLEELPCINSYVKHTNVNLINKKGLLHNSNDHNDDNNNISRGIFHDLVGHYEYITTCDFCSCQSRRLARFYELDLNILNHTNLYQCLQEFCQKETLDGDNQFCCSRCMCKRNANRNVQLTQLPIILNFQLLRFVYDKDKGNKKKLTNRLDFPQVLDMQPFLPDLVSPSFIYDLYAVLIHNGSSANSGHYIALIRINGNSNTDATTYLFNDEVVTKVESGLSGVDLDSLLEMTDSKNKKKKKLPVGELSSSNAYMLVYKRRTDENFEINANVEMEIEDITISNLPTKLRAKIIEHNRIHENILEGRELSLAKETEKLEFIRALYSNAISLREISCEERMNLFDWVKTEWLSSYLQPFSNKPDNPNIVDLKFDKFKCPHNKLNHTDVTHFKLLPKDKLDIIEKDEAFLRLSCEEALCHVCVKDHCESINLKLSLLESVKLINSLLKSNREPEEYIVSKNFWRNWQTYVKRRIKVKDNNATEENNNESIDENIESNESEANLKKLIISNGNKEEEEEEMEATSSNADSQISQAEFNTELICSHNDLKPDEKLRKYIPKVVWQILLGYFPTAYEFMTHMRSCPLCQNEMDEDERERELNKNEASLMKYKLHDLYLGKKRPIFLKNNSNLKTTFNFKDPSSLPKTNGNVLLDNINSKDITLINNSNLIDALEKINYNINSKCKNNSTFMENVNNGLIEGSSHMSDESNIYNLNNRKINSEMVFDSKDSNNNADDNIEEFYYLLEKEFLFDWRKFIRDPSRNKKPTTTINKALLCHHNKLSHMVSSSVLKEVFESDFRANEDVLVEFLTKEEWKILINHMILYEEIKFQIVYDIHLRDYTFKFSPEVCEICLADKTKMEMESQYDYENGKLFIHLVTEEEDVERETNTHSYRLQNNETTAEHLYEDGDQEFNPNKLGKKRKIDKKQRPINPNVLCAKKNISNFPTANNQSNKYQSNAQILSQTIADINSLGDNKLTINIPTLDQVRRSNRNTMLKNGRNNGIKEIAVHSNMTLRELHIEIYKIFNIFKTNQSLFLNGTELMGDDCTLSSLHIFNHAKIDLKVLPDVVNNDYFKKDCNIEAGFKGTALSNL